MSYMRRTLRSGFEDSNSNSAVVKGAPHTTTFPAGSTDETLSKSIGRSIGLLRKAFSEAQKLKSLAEREESRDKLLQALKNGKTPDKPYPTLPVKRTALPAHHQSGFVATGTLSKGLARDSSTLEGQRPISLEVVPKAPAIPAYKAWSYLVRNEVAVEVGRKMFYTDSTGETVPASDSEDEVRGDDTLEGIYREREQHVISGIVEEQGNSKQIVKILASKLNSTRGGVESFIKEMAAAALPPPAERAFASLPKLLGRFDAMFCRRCRTYNCLTHRGQQVRPLNRPIPPAAKGKLPCGPHCVMNASQGKVPAGAGLSGAQSRTNTHGLDRTRPEKRQRRGLNNAVDKERVAYPAKAGSLQQGKCTVPRNEEVVVLTDTASESGSLPDEPLPVPGAGGLHKMPAFHELTGSRGTSEGDSNNCASSNFGTSRPISTMNAGTVAVQNRPSRFLREERGLLRPPADIIPDSDESPAKPLQLPSEGDKRPSSSTRVGVAWGRTDADALKLAPARRKQGRSPAKGIAFTRPSGWSEYEAELLAQAQTMHGEDSCKIARLLGSRTCAEVAAAVKQKLGADLIEEEHAHAPSVSHQCLTRRKGVSSQRRRVISKIALKRSQHKDPLWEDYKPCNCPGGCGDSCPCLASKQFCQKFCACSPNCVHFFPGCVCSGGCRTRICPCQAAGFECDPDICKGCQCAALGGEPPPGKELCRNMRLRLRQHKRIAVGLSSIAGWGAFLMEPARKNELIGEYTGELVDQQEAERRGKVYDRDDNSYLFNLNLSWVIDARMRGNKLRFANHSMDPNCRAEILMVDGDHRVGIFAIRDIPAGQELLYNYLYTQDQAPEWAKTG